MKTFYLLLLCICCRVAVTAHTVQVNFTPVFGSQILKPGQTHYHTSTADSIRIEVCRFYISHIKFMHDKNVVFDAAAQVYLIDMADTVSQQLQFTLPDGVNWNAISFCLGTDSATNVSGALGGSLDPANGMYWAWQSGYINFKLEGSSPRCTARKHEFQFHLGGYASPFATLQQIRLDCVQSSNINVVCDTAKFFDYTDVKTTAAIMSPGARAVELSVAAAGLFAVKP